MIQWQLPPNPLPEAEERNFCKVMLHFMNTLRIEEKQGDLLHVATVCTDLTNVVTKNYLGKGASQPEHVNQLQLNKS